MAVTSSNTFHKPASSDTLADSRVYFNSSLQALLENFASANAIPVAANHDYEGALTGAKPGQLWYNSNTGGLYLNSYGTPQNYGLGPYGYFRRMGLGTRAYTAIDRAEVDHEHLDPGELIVVINNTAGSANNRVYLVSDQDKKLVDVSEPYERSVSNTALVAKSVTQHEIANNAIRAEHIADGTIVKADIADESITDEKLDSTLVLLGMVL